MDNELDKYSQISLILSAIPELCDPLKITEEVKKTDQELWNMQQEIKSLHSHCGTVDPSSAYVEVANDMLKNITDGRFEHFLNNKPTISDSVDAELLTTKKYVNLVKVDMEKLQINTQGAAINLEDLYNIFKKKRTNEDNKEILHQVKNASNILQCNFNQLDISEHLLKNNQRDFRFEADIKKVINDINEINKFIEARRIIKKLEKQKPQESTTASLQLYSAISTLLADVERTNYSGEMS